MTYVYAHSLVLIFIVSYDFIYYNFPFSQFFFDHLSCLSLVRLILLAYVSINLILFFFVTQCIIYYIQSAQKKKNNGGSFSSENYD